MGEAVSPFFDLEGETLDRELRAARQLARFQALLDEILPDNRFYASKLAGLDRVTSWQEFAALPFTRKTEISNDQIANPPFGTNLTYPLDRYVKLHQTSGTSGKAPIRWLDTEQSWQWWARLWGHVYRGAGVGAGDRVFFAFSFGPFIGFWSAHEGARVVGAMAIPGGGMQTQQRIDTLLASKATALCCTPTYALRMAEEAGQTGIDLASSPIRATIHAGEPGASIPQVRERLERLWGAQCHDHTGMTEIGATGFTCQEQAGVHLIESEFIFEVIDPASGQPVAPGGQGELVITNLGRGCSPLIRYRTGDLVQLDVERCDCGRTFARMLGGILGRADDMLLIRGVNVFPSAIEGIVREFADVVEFRIEVTRQREMAEARLLLEPSPDRSNDEANSMAALLSETLRRRLLVRIPCEAVSPGTLPRFELKAQRIVKL